MRKNIASGLQFSGKTRVYGSQFRILKRTKPRLSLLLSLQIMEPSFLSLAIELVSHTFKLFK